MEEKDHPKPLGVLGSIATILGTCIAFIALIPAFVALIPAFGQWLYPREPINNTNTPKISPVAADLINPTGTTSRSETPTFSVTSPVPTSTSPIPSSTSIIETVSPAPLLTEDLLPLKRGYFEVSIQQNEEQQSSPQAFSFEHETQVSEDVPFDIIFSDCSLDVYKQYCTIGANAVWYMGQVPLDEITDTSSSRDFSLEYSPVEFGSTYIISTYTNHLAKFRVTWVDRSYPSFKFGINWVYQPNKRPDFASFAPEETKTLDNPQQGIFKVVLDMDQESNHSPKAFSFEQGSVASGMIPADIVFSDCSYDVWNYYCGIGANAVWYLGDDLPLDNNFDTSHSKNFSLNYAYINPGSTYIISTFNGHLAKFRVTYVDKDNPSFNFGLSWIYLP